MDRLDVMIEAVQRAEQDLRDYRWMADESGQIDIDRPAHAELVY